MVTVQDEELDNLLPAGLAKNMVNHVSKMSTDETIIINLPEAKGEPVSPYFPLSKCQEHFQTITCSLKIYNQIILLSLLGSFTVISYCARRVIIIRYY